MSLKDEQVSFTKRVPLLINKAFELGYEVTLGDCHRNTKCPYGSKTSFHHRRLAIDLNLFRGGVYVTSTEGHRALGEYWESLGGVWGGRFNDGNHYQSTRTGWLS